MSASISEERDPGAGVSRPAPPERSSAVESGVPTRAAWVAAGVIVAVGIALSLFGSWEMDGETWGYWYFARVFNETGLLAAWDRSPLYVLYLSAFSRVAYPASVAIEYVVTSVIFCTAFSALLSGTRLLVPGAVASVVMLPIVWNAAPNVQILALAATFLAFAALLSSWDKSLRISVALFFLSLAYLFRSTYVVVLVIVLGYLIISNATGIQGYLKRLRYLGRLVVPAAAFIAALWSYSAFRQAAHPWNNVFFASTQWFPINVNSLFDAGFISHLNWIYIGEKYPGETGIDFYRTNQELFQGATTAREAALANPRFVVHAMAENVRTMFDQGGRMTRLWSPFVTAGFSGSYIFIVVGMIFAAAIGVVVFSKRFRPELRLMFVSLAAVASTSLLAMPKKRYMAGLAAVLFFICVWAVEALPDRIRRLGRGFRPVVFGIAAVAVTSLVPMTKAGYLAAMAVIVVLAGATAVPALAQGYGSLRARLARTRAFRDPRRLYAAGACVLYVLITPETVDIVHLASQRATSGARVLERLEGSMKVQAPILAGLARDCRGIMGLEHTFIGAFVAPKGTHVYDVFEIPPFGSLDSTSYTGLRPQRVDCLFVSDELVAGTGTGTETFNRYHRYIMPYAESLKSRGATAVSVAGYGYVIQAGKGR